MESNARIVVASQKTTMTTNGFHESKNNEKLGTDSVSNFFVKIVFISEIKSKT